MPTLTPRPPRESKLFSTRPALRFRARPTASRFRRCRRRYRKTFALKRRTQTPAASFQPLSARRVLADAGFCRQRAFAENGQEALYRIRPDHERIGLTRRAIFQRRHFCHSSSKLTWFDRKMSVFLFE